VNGLVDRFLLLGPGSDKFGSVVSVDRADLVDVEVDRFLLFNFGEVGVVVDECADSRYSPRLGDLVFTVVSDD